MKRACVFCGSATGTREIYARSARDLGRALTKRNIGLVFGGGHIGRMGILADAVLQAGGQTWGVIPQALVDKELAHTGLTELHVVKTMHERKALMADLADAFIALPGGVGTADEFFEILTWRQLGIHSKPIGILNVNGFFDHLLAWLDHASSEGFLLKDHRRLIEEADEPETLLDLISTAGFAEL
jgi:uncharacterized protein (TIGR00730 family)